MQHNITIRLSLLERTVIQYQNNGKWTNGVAYLVREIFTLLSNNYSSPFEISNSFTIQDAYDLSDSELKEFMADIGFPNVSIVSIKHDSMRGRTTIKIEDSTADD